MNITDELREYASTRISPNKGMLEAIADRIDAKHERGMADAYLSGTPTDEQMAEHGWIRLPKDADGVPIRFGDKVTVWWSEKVYEVRGFSYTEQLAGSERIIWVDVYSLEKMRNIPLCGASSCHHYHAPTVEDVLREFADEVYADTENEIRDRDFLCAKYAKRLTLAGDAE